MYARADAKPSLGQQLIRHCLRSGNFVGLRTLTAQLLSHRMLMRVDFLPKIELSDFGVEHMDGGGGRGVPYLTVSTRGSKVEPANAMLYTGALRHKHALFCCVFAVAMMLFYRYHIDFEDLPSYFVDKEWYWIKLMVSARPEPVKPRGEADDEAAVEASDDVRMQEAEIARLSGVDGGGADDSRMDEDDEDDEDEDEDEEVVPVPKPSRPLTRVESELSRNATIKKLTGTFKAAVTDEAPVGFPRLSIYGRDAGEC